MAAAQSGPGPATLWANGTRCGPADAALANGTAVHGFELDDMHEGARAHPGSFTVPAALALAEARGAPGAALITAIVAGYEVAARVGIAGGEPHGTGGLHPTGTVGSVGAAAAAAAMLGLDPARATHALAIGATQAAGLYSARLGAMTKRMHAGRAAQSGVYAGLLAERGFTGAEDALEAPFGGFLSTLAAGGADPEALTRDLGTKWEILEGGFKIYSACGGTHTTIDVLDEFMRQGLRADNLAALKLRYGATNVRIVGWRYTPSPVVAAQMNVSFASAMKLLEGEVFVHQYREDRLAAPEVLSLIERIEVAHDPEMDTLPYPAGDVEARLVDGRVMRKRLLYGRGSDHVPLTEDEIKEKFRVLAEVALPGPAVARLRERALGAAALSDSRALLAELG